MRFCAQRRSAHHGESMQALNALTFALQGVYLYSPDGGVYLVAQGDGNLVL